MRDEEESKGPIHVFTSPRVLWFAFGVIMVIGWTIVRVTGHG